MKLLDATQVAVEIVSKLTPYCDKVEVAGSIRRGRANVHDIDIVAVPNEDKLLAGGFFGRQHLISTMAYPAEPRTNGTKIATFLHKGRTIEEDIAVDIYWATPETWGTLLLIRTGSKEHNIKLCMLARDKGWKLHASGEGLFDAYDRRIASSAEEGIFAALGLPFIPPGKREVRYPAAFRGTVPEAREKILDITT